MTPANSSLNLLCAATLLKKSSQSLAIKGIASFKLANGQLGYGHNLSQRKSNLDNRWAASLISKFLFDSLSLRIETVNRFWLEKNFFAFCLI